MKINIIKNGTQGMLRRRYMVMQHTTHDISTDILRVFYGCSTGFLRVQSVEMQRISDENAEDMRRTSVSLTAPAR